MIDDPKERGIRRHAFEALHAFADRLDTARRHLREGWTIYEEEAQAIVDAASAALPFLDKRIAEALEDAVRSAEGVQLAKERGLLEDYAAGKALSAVAILVVEATLGVPDKKIEEPKPAPAPKPAAVAADEIPF